MIVAHQIGVRADTHVVDTDELYHMIDMIDDVLDRRRLLVFDEHAHAGNTHDAALCRELANRLVGFETRMVIERAAIRMRKGDGLGG